MNRPKLLFTFTFLLSLLLVISAAAQPETATLPDTSYDVQLQLIVGSNDASGKAEIPSNLSAITRQLRSNFAFSDYRVSNTFIGRIANGGTFEYKSISGISGRESEPELQSFLEWSMATLQTAPALASGVQARGFRFGARVPIKTGVDSNGRAIYAYEPVGLNLNRINLAANKPTLVGTLSLPRTDGTIFVVMTVRSAEL
jgi:hypothetical protein